MVFHLQPHNIVGNIVGNSTETAPYMAELPTHATDRHDYQERQTRPEAEETRRWWWVNPVNSAEWHQGMEAPIPLRR